MPITAGLADIVTREIPPMISPESHACADFLIAGSFLLAAAFFYRKTPRASAGAALCGGVGFCLAALTDYSGRGGRPISLRTHQKMDLGLAALAGSMPKFLSFRESPEELWFTAGAVAITALANLTDYRPRSMDE